MNSIQAWFNGWVVTKAHGPLAHGQKGSDTSGNWLHKGRRGKRGGSLPGGGHKTLGIASDATPAEIKDEVAARREERKDKKPDQGPPIAPGKYIRAKAGVSGGKVVKEIDYLGTKDAYLVQIRNGDLVAFSKKVPHEEISKDQAIRQGFEAPKAHKPSPPPKKLPKGASFYAQTTTQLGKEFAHKIRLVQGAVNRLQARLSSGKGKTANIERDLRRYARLATAIREEYNRLLDEFSGAGV